MTPGPKTIGTRHGGPGLYVHVRKDSCCLEIRLAAALVT